MRNSIIVMIVAGILIVLAFMQPDGFNKEQTAKVGFQSPRFELQGLSGESFSLADLNGKPALINFWASWCGPCRKEAPELVRLYEQYKDQIAFYAINMTADDSIAGAKAFVEEFKLPFPILMDENGAVTAQYRVKSIPTTFFVDGRGTIQSITTGLVASDSLEKQILQAINAPRGAT